MGISARFSARNSTSDMAWEYASSPVEHPGTQMRIGPVEVRACKWRIDNARERCECLWVAEEAGYIDEQIVIKGVDFGAVAMQQGAIVA